MSFLTDLSMYRKQIGVSLLMYLAFFLMAGRLIIMGASLLDVEIQIQKDFATTSRLITSQSAGYFTGAVLGE